MTMQFIFTSAQKNKGVMMARDELKFNAAAATGFKFTVGRQKLRLVAGGQKELVLSDKKSARCKVRDTHARSLARHPDKKQIKWH